jgi:hypothetical protein
MSCCAVLCCGLQVRYGTMRENVMAMEVCRQGECILMHAHACSLGPPGSPEGIETTALALSARAVPAFPVYSCWWPLMSMHSGLRGVTMQYSQHGLSFANPAAERRQHHADSTRLVVVRTVTVTLL